MTQNRYLDNYVNLHIQSKNFDIVYMSGHCAFFCFASFCDFNVISEDFKNNNNGAYFF